MSIKRRLLPLKIILCVFLAVVLICAAAVGYLIHQGYGASVGRILVTDSYRMLIVEETPTVLSDPRGVGLLENLKTGDYVLVIHDGITDNYPSHTCAYFIVTLTHGTQDDLSPETLDRLSELGWI